MHSCYSQWTSCLWLVGHVGRACLVPINRLLIATFLFALQPLAFEFFDRVINAIEKFPALNCQLECQVNICVKFSTEDCAYSRSGHFTSPSPSEWIIMLQVKYYSTLLVHWDFDFVWLLGWKFFLHTCTYMPNIMYTLVNAQYNCFRHFHFIRLPASENNDKWSTSALTGVIMGGWQCNDSVIITNIKKAKYNWS